MRSRVQQMMRAWHRPNASMDKDDWIFVGAMCAGAPIAFMFGFVIGLLLTK